MNKLLVSIAAGVLGMATSAMAADMPVKAKKAAEKLTFPRLSRSECQEATPTEACYFSEDDVEGISAKSIEIGRKV